MERHCCPHARTIRKRLGMLCELAHDLPEGHVALRAALDDLASDWDVLLSSCARLAGPADETPAPLSGMEGESPPQAAQDAPPACPLPCPLATQDTLQIMLDNSHAQVAYLDCRFNFSM